MAIVGITAIAYGRVVQNYVMYTGKIIKNTRNNNSSDHSEVFVFE